MAARDEEKLSPAQQRRKHRLERWAIVAVAAGLMILTLVQREVIDLGLSDSRGLVALVSINFSVLLTTFLILLILRNLYRVFFEQQYGSLQTKMVMAFICLSLLPTLLIFYYSYRQLVRGHNLWFSSQIEEALSDSLTLTEDMLQADELVLTGYGGDILNEYAALEPTVSLAALGEFLENSRRRFHLTSVEFYGPQGQLVSRGGQENLPPIYRDWFDRQMASAPPWENIVETERGDLTRLVWPLLPPSISPDSEPRGYLAIGRLTLAPVRSQMEDVRQALRGYRDALGVQRPYRVTQLTALTAMTMLAVFISIWIGSHLARSLAGPVTELVEGTRKVAAGDWDFTISQPRGRAGEFAALVGAFNQMTGELKTMYAELDSRRRFLETVLKNVSTGVAVLDEQGRPLHFNAAADSILFGETAVRAENGAVFRRQEPDRLLPAPLAELIGETLAAPQSSRRLADRHLRLSVGQNSLSLRVSLSPLANEDGEHLAYLMTFDDLTELEKAQRLAAWREVARRIAHEVKNPLTPIQLAAQRLHRRFLPRLATEEDAAVFEECTEVIIRQVDEMKKLVDEFSQFARLPEIKPRPGDFAALLEESVALFRQAHKKVEFALTVKSQPPVFSFDPEQLRRVITNLLDNAVAAMNREGRVDLTLGVDDLQGLRLEIADTGPGLDAAVRDRVFDPHFTTKEGGQGLGLAIVRTIVSDHGGFVRAKNQPGRGAKFIIELPLRP
ncbi:MAG: HAMP domain-containing protein [Candidatus Adiutrix sp.]|nr:HAMP domain-containing protein [Candidatus Adiutrix sp.]